MIQTVDSIQHLWFDLFTSVLSLLLITNFILTSGFALGSTLCLESWQLQIIIHIVHMFTIINFYILLWMCSGLSLANNRGSFYQLFWVCLLQRFCWFLISRCLQDSHCYCRHWSFVGNLKKDNLLCTWGYWKFYAITENACVP